MARLLLFSSPVLNDRTLRLLGVLDVRPSGADVVFTLPIEDVFGLTCTEEDASPTGIDRMIGRSEEVTSSTGGVLGKDGVIVEFKFSLLLL